MTSRPSYPQDLNALVVACTRGANRKESFSALKVVAKGDAGAIRDVFQNVWVELEAESSSVRLGALYLCDYLFRRSKEFRALLCDQLSLFLSLVSRAGERALPPPPDAAQDLEQKGIQCIQAWNSLFGERYAQLEVALRFLTEFHAVQPDPEMLAARPSPGQPSGLANVTSGQDTAPCFQGAEALAASALTCLRCVHALLDMLGYASSRVLPEAWERSRPPCALPAGVDEHLADPGASAREGTADNGFDWLFEDVEQMPAPAKASEMCAEIKDEGSSGFGVAHEIPLGPSEVPSARGLGKGAHAAVVEALREARKLLQRRHLPRLQQMIRSLQPQTFHPREEADDNVDGSSRPVTGSSGRPSSVIADLVSHMRELHEAGVVACTQICEACETEPEHASKAKSTLHTRSRRQKASLEPKDSGSSRTIEYRDPAAPNMHDPYTVVVHPKEGVRDLHCHLASPTHGRTRLKDSSRPDQHPLKQKSTLDPKNLHEVLKKAPVLQPGPFLKLWESEESQMAFVKQHMMAGQIYNHWGRHDLDVELDPKVVTNMLAMRASFEPAKLVEQVETAPAQHQVHRRGAALHRHLSSKVQDTVQPSADLNDTSLSTKEVRRAERAYTQSVLARAGEQEVDTIAKPVVRPRVAKRKRTTAVQQQLMQLAKRAHK